MTKEHRRRWSRSIAKSRGERDQRDGEGKERKEKEEEEVCAKADRNAAREEERLGWLG